jgi:hypothetical protein
MKLDIEKWVDNHNFSTSVVLLFKESIVCYKASAYKAALLFSYLGFQTIIKERILKSEKPSYLADWKWNDTIKKLQRGDGWDTEVNECIKTIDEKKRLFVLSDDIREQARYWKNRRNDCAHSKSNIIDAAHVESFWLFLKSNLPKFVVNGGMESLLNKIEKHFDIDYTREDESFMELVHEAPLALQEGEHDQFVYRVNKIFEEGTFYYPDSELNVRELDFWYELIKVNDDLETSIIALIKNNKALELNFLAAKLELITIFYGQDKSEIRNLWRDKIVKFEDRIAIICGLLKYGLVTDEKEEMLRHFVNNIRGTFLRDQYIEELKRHGYFKVYKEMVFGDDLLLNNFRWANNSYDSIGDHLHVIGLDEQTVSAINGVFDGANYPYKMRSALERYLDNNANQRQRYIEICHSLQINPTDRLGFN